MSIVHFTTELTGGAGSVVVNIHKAMLSMGIRSRIITREFSVVDECTVVEPFTNWEQKLRSLISKLNSVFKIIDPKYALFGIQKSPIKLSQVQSVLDEHEPKVLMFYWMSYFIDYKLILELKSRYPGVEVFFICLDEAFLTGGCHYSTGCEGYQKSCSDCPATRVKSIKFQINRDFESKIDILAQIEPTIIYPSSQLKAIGLKSSALKTHKSYVIPLGAVFREELDDISRAENFPLISAESRKLKLLVRSSSEVRKGCDLFLSALSIVQSEFLGLRERLEVFSIGDDYFSKSNISQIVDYSDLGVVDRTSLLAIYSNVDALVVSSREDSGPLMINECVAAGVFVISTPIGVANDLIISDRKGIVARAINQRAIADTLLEFLKISDVKNSRSETHNSDALTFEGYSLALLGLLPLVAASE